MADFKLFLHVYMEGDNSEDGFLLFKQLEPLQTGQRTRSCNGTQLEWVKKSLKQKYIIEVWEKPQGVTCVPIYTIDTQFRTKNKD